MASDIRIQLARSLADSPQPNAELPPFNYVIKTDYDDPDLAVVMDVADDAARNISVAFLNQFEKETDERPYIPPAELGSECDEQGVKQYTYNNLELRFESKP